MRLVRVFEGLIDAVPRVGLKASVLLSSGKSFILFHVQEDQQNVTMGYHSVKVSFT